MKEHIWTTEEVDGGHVGVGDFWICKECGASGGPVWFDDNEPPRHPFYADGMGLELTADCDESKKLIEEHVAAGSPRHFKIVDEG